MKNVSSVLYLSFCVLYLQGCGLLKQEHKSKSTNKTIFVKGNPYDLVEGSKMETQSFFTKENIEIFQKWAYAGVLLLEEKTKADNSPSSQKSLEKENAANTGSKKKILGPMNLVEEEDGTYKLKRSIFMSTSIPELILKPEGEKLVVVGFKLNGNLYNADVLHYSLSEDQKAMSLLLDGSSENNRRLMVLKYIRPTARKEKLEDVEEKYNYLAGPGKRARWEKPLNIDLCGKAALSEATVMKEALNQWRDENNTIGGRDFTIGEVEQAPPFSDMNSHCLLVTDSYLFEDSPNSGVLGVTLPIIDHYGQEILAGDIFVSKAAHRKVLGSRASDVALAASLYRSTIIHEFGHFLGLDHEFEKNEDGKALFPSIMSYDFLPGVEAHDREAIRELYK